MPSIFDDTTTFYISGSNKPSNDIDLFLRNSIVMSDEICPIILSPLYDNEETPSPEESGYQGWMTSDSNQYNGINGQARWGFYNSLTCAEKYHFSVDDTEENVKTVISNPTYSHYDKIVSQYDFTNNWTDSIGNVTLTNWGASFVNSGYLCGAPSAKVNDTFSFGYAFNDNVTLDYYGGSGHSFKNGTVSAWIEIDDVTTTGNITQICGFGHTGSYDFSIYYDSTDSKIYVDDSVYGATQIGSIGAGWHMVTLTIQGENLGSFSGYIDNVLTGSGFISNPANSSYKRFAVGARPISDGELITYGGNSGLNFILIDNLMIFDSYFNTGDVDSLFKRNQQITIINTGYFEYIGCSGWNLYNCNTDCDNSGVRGDDDYLYTKIPSGVQEDSNSIIYWYYGYDSSRTATETKNVLDFQLREIPNWQDPSGISLQFRANVSTPFKIENTTLYDNTGNIIATGDNQILDGYGTCGPYEIPLHINTSGADDWDLSRTRLYSKLFIDENCLSGYLYSPVGMSGSYRYATPATGNDYAGIIYPDIEFNYEPDYSYGYYDNAFEYHFVNIPSGQYIVGMQVLEVIDSGLNSVFFTVDGDTQSIEINLDNNLYIDGPITNWHNTPKTYSGDFYIHFQVEFDATDSGGAKITLNREPFLLNVTEGLAIKSNLGLIQISQMDVAVDMACFATGINDYCELHTIGSAPISSGLSLFTTGGNHENMPLFVKGYGDTGTNNLPLFLDARESGIEYGDANNNSTLYIQSIPVCSGDGLNLYISAPSSGFEYGGMNLFVNNTDGWINKNSGINLYLRALESGNNTTTLYLKARDYGVSSDYYDISGDMPLYIFGTGVFSSNAAIDAYICGKMQPFDDIDLFLAVASEQSGNFNLYINGWGDIATKNTNLYIKGYGGKEFANHQLFILGPNPDKVSGELPLFIEGGGTDFRSNAIDLNILGGVLGDNLNSIPLFIQGGYDFTDMPLVLYNNTEISSFANSGTLYIAGFDGTTISGMLAGLTDLYIKGDVLYDSVNLFIKNSGIDSMTGQIYLTMIGRDIIYDSMNSGVDFVVYNNYIVQDSGIELFLYSQQNYDMSGQLNLFMSRSAESAAIRTDMFISGPLSENSGLSMYINGGTDAYNNITLYMPSSIDTVLKNVSLYSHGF